MFAEDGTAVPVTVLDVAGNRVTQIKTPRPTATLGRPGRHGKRRPSRVASRRPATSRRRASRRRHVAEWNSGQRGRDSPLQAGDVVGGHVRARPARRRDRHDEGPGASPGVVAATTSAEPRVARQLGDDRAPGSIGMAQDPGRVFPGKRMAGPVTATRRAPVQNATVVPRRRRAPAAARQGLGPGADGGAG